MNRVEIMGRLNWKEIKYFESGTCRTKILLSKKRPKANNADETQNYDSFPIIFFNNKAEDFAEYIAEGDYVHVVGSLTRNQPKNKTSKETEIIGWDFRKTKWSNDKNKYVYADDENEVVGYGKIDRKEVA